MLHIGTSPPPKGNMSHARALFTEHLRNKSNLQLHTTVNNIIRCLWIRQSNSSCSVQLSLSETALVCPTHPRDKTCTAVSSKFCLLGDIKTDSVPFSQYWKPTGWDSWNHWGFGLQSNFSMDPSSRSSPVFTRCGHKLHSSPLERLLTKYYKKIPTLLKAAFSFATSACYSNALAVQLGR